MKNEKCYSMLNSLRSSAFCILLAVSSAFALNISSQSLTDYVDPRIGTGDHGHVFVGANVPFGMVNAGPTQLEHGWDWCSGYHESGKKIAGFGQMHLSGTGCGDLGDVCLMPCYGEQQLSSEGLASTYSHDNETIRPGYYSVVLDKYSIQTEVTATNRVALYRFTYPTASNDARIVIDLTTCVGGNIREVRVVPLDDHTLIGYRRTNGWANDRHVYFTIQFSRPFSKWISLGDNQPFGQAVFQVSPSDKILTKVALSPTSEANSLLNMKAETGTAFDFESIRSQATEKWNRELSRINATFRTERERTIFYTALYHYMVAPQTWCDVNGDYMGADLAIHRNASFTNLTTWSLWDTYRAAHPLATIILPDKMSDYAHTMMAIYGQSGELPMWHLTSNETYCMVGEPGVPVLADIILKGYPSGIDPEEALKAMKASLLPTEYAERSIRHLRGKDHLSRLGYLPFDKEGESVAKNLEYYLACWSAARVAGMLGHTADSIRFSDLAMNYKKLYDPRARCMRALDSNGQFRELPADFNPCHQTGDYTEGNPWQYTFLVPHDINGLVELMGGRKAFTQRLDSLFTADADLGENANPDITGLIGQYAHGNEPSHHILYIYNYIDQPHKTQRLVRKVMDELYTDKPAGLCGNEDVGQMSAWYILSALGLYQVEPCGGIYQLGSPIVEQASIPLPNGRQFVVRTHNGRADKPTVKKYVLNGTKLTRTYITHQEITAGGTLEIYF